MAKPRYAKLKGDAWRNPKLAGLSDAAFRLWINCVSYCADNLTDGFIPEHIVPALLPTPMPLDMPLAELTAEPGLLVKEGRMYIVAKYLDHNVSREEIEKHSQMQRKKAEKRWGNKKTAAPAPAVKVHADPLVFAAGNAAGNAKYKYKNKNNNTNSSVWMVKAINEIYREVFGTDWFGYAKYQEELDQLGEWAKQQASADGCTPHEAVVIAGKGWRDDPYVVEQSYGPLPLLWRKAPVYYAKGRGSDAKGIKNKLQELERQEAKAYKEGNHDESSRLQKAIANLQQSSRA